MENKIILKKLRAEFTNPVTYYFPDMNTEINLNQLLGKTINIAFTGNIFCLGCHKKIPKSYGQGYCYQCFTTLPENEECVLRPELCRAHLGIARNMEYARLHCLNDHIVYLSVTSGLKVGVTRISQIPARWIDQGAGQAIKLAQTQNRYQAGMVEVALKKHIADKTNWKSMLRYAAPELDLSVEKEKIKNHIPADFTQFITSDNNITSINYPVLSLPSNPVNISLDKTTSISARLSGIKGQYLMFDNQNVLNIRKHGGYEIVFSDR